VDTTSVGAESRGPAIRGLRALLAEGPAGLRAVRGRADRRRSHRAAAAKKLGRDRHGRAQRRPALPPGLLAALSVDATGHRAGVGLSTMCIIWTNLLHTRASRSRRAARLSRITWKEVRGQTCARPPGPAGGRSGKPPGDCCCSGMSELAQWARWATTGPPWTAATVSDHGPDARPTRWFGLMEFSAGGCYFYQGLTAA